MASKGQKFNSYSKELKKEIMQKYLNNEGTANSLSKEYNISLRTMKNWVNKINKKITEQDLRINGLAQSYVLIMK